MQYRSLVFVGLVWMTSCNTDMTEVSVTNDAGVVPAPIPTSLGLPIAAGTPSPISSPEASLKYQGTSEEVVPVDIFVDFNESLQAISKWSEISVKEILDMNDMKSAKELKQGMALTLPMTPSKLDDFNGKRKAFHEKLKVDFEAKWDVVGLGTYTIEKGDNLTKISNKFQGVPAWVMHDYNKNLDFSALKVGSTMSIPLIQPKEETLDGSGSDKTTVTVQKGETLDLYSKWSGIPIEKILKVNGMKPGSSLKAGQVITLFLPESSYIKFMKSRKEYHAKKADKIGVVIKGKEYWSIYEVKKGDTMAKIAKSLDLDKERIMDYNQDCNTKNLKIGQKLKIPNSDKTYDELNLP